MTSERNDPHEEKKEKKQNKLLIIIIILLLIALLFCGTFIGVFVFGGFGNNGGGGGVVVDPNLGDLENQEKPVQKPGVVVPGWTKLTIPSKSIEITDIPFYNPEENEGLYYLTFEIRLLDTDGKVSEVLATSGAVPPGKKLSSLTLSRALRAGTYDAMLHVQPYDIEDNSPVNNVDAKLTLIVV